MAILDFFNAGEISGIDMKGLFYLRFFFIITIWISNENQLTDHYKIKYIITLLHVTILTQIIKKR